MPKKLNFFESAIRALLKEYIQRGKVDVFITYEDLSHKSAALSYNPAIAAQYMEYFRQMEEEFGLKNDIGVSDLAKCPEVLTLEEQQENEEEIWNLLEQAVRGACIKFVETLSLIHIWCVRSFRMMYVFRHTLLSLHHW